MSSLHWLDISVIVLFFMVIFSIAIYYSKKAGKDTGQFFLSGRNMPWYIAGTAMVATTFAADTPLAVTEIIAKNGIAGNWLWWNMAIGGMLTVFFFAKLWRRSGIMTDVEFVEFRYDGKAAAVLRGFRAVYLGLFMNIIILGWVHLAMETIFYVTFPGVNAFLLTIIVAFVVAIYASASGLLGTARTDSFQFVFAMVGCIVLAVIVIRLPEVGGIVQLKEKLAPQVLDFFPRIGSIDIEGVTGGALALSAGAFIAHIGLQWWATWYPGADPGGGGYVAQRMMSAKDEKHSLFATLWFNVAHYTIRPWPWILVALAALVILPRGDSAESLRIENPAVYEQVVHAYEDEGGMPPQALVQRSAEFQAMYEKYENTVNPRVMYPKLMIRYLPKGLLGLLLAVFMAAYMSTIASQLNWGTSYLVNDFYRRFILKSSEEKHYVLISRMGILLMIILSLIVTKFFLSDIQGAWLFVINASAGIGTVLILRWFWWRINAWSEISAMITPLIVYPIVTKVFGMKEPITLFPIVAVTTLVWIIVTFLTKPVNMEKLVKFYKKVHPGGNGWKPVAVHAPDVKADKGLGRLFVDWMCGVILVYAALLGIGKIILNELGHGIIYLVVAAAAASVIAWDLKQRGAGVLSGFNES